MDSMDAVRCDGMRWTVVVARLSAGGAISLRDLIYAMRPHIAHLSNSDFVVEGGGRGRSYLLLHFSTVIKQYVWFLIICIYETVYVWINPHLRPLI